MLKELSSLVSFPIAAVNGAVKPYPKELLSVIRAKEASPSYSAYALEPETLLEDLLSVMSNKSIKIGNIPSSTSALAFHASFTDAHKLPLGFSANQDEVIEIIDKVVGKSKTQAEPVSVPEQFEIALSASNNNVSEATINLAVASRHMARAQDNNILPLPVNQNDMLNWKKAVGGSLQYSDRFTDDAPGDLYHLWGAMLIGMARQNEVGTLTGSLTGQVTDRISRNIPKITYNLRTRIVGHEGEVHGTDWLGYEVGRAMIGYLNNN